MTVKEEVKFHPGAVDYFKELPFYNKHIEKPKIKRLKNIDLFSELPFYEELNVIKTDHAFRGYAMSYKVKIAEKKKIQLNSQKQVNQVLKTCLVIKPNVEIEFRLIYFNSTTKTVINH